METIIRERIAPKQPIVVQEFTSESPDYEEMKLKLQKKKLKIQNLKVLIK